MHDFEILHYPNPQLMQVAGKVEEVDDDVRFLFERLKKAMLDYDGVGLAAPQVGVPLRLIVMSVNGRTFELANPVVSWRSGLVSGPEGCLSLPGETWEVDRAREVVVEGLSPSRAPVSVLANDLLARVFQHEIDHLGGVLINAKGRWLQTEDSRDSVQADHH